MDPDGNCCSNSLANCNKCSNDGSQCTECTGIYYNYNGQCYLCHTTCDKCQGPNANQCRDCKESNTYRIGGTPGTCTCNGGRYDADPTDNLDCQKCDKTCNTCIWGGPNDCDSCKSNAHLYNGLAVNNCECTVDEYWMDNNGDCQPCSYHIGMCEKCSTDGLTCNQCFSPYSLSGNMCATCHGTCTTCSDTGIDDCLTCTGNHQFLDNGKCKCIDGYYDADSAYEVLDCQPCHPSCKTCNWGDSDDCKSCKSNAQLKSGYCRCNSTHYMDNAGICQLCGDQIQNCYKCNYFATSCDECFVGYFLENSTTCTQCHSSCYSCSERTANDCNQCADANTYLSPTLVGTCKCKIGFYDDLSIPPNLNCLDCHPTCTECDLGGPSGCTVCPTGTNTELNGADPTNCQCIAGYYDEWDSDLINCQHCPDSCAECYKSGTDIICTACDNPANAEIAATPDHCICSDGYVNTSGSGSLTCTGCFNSCATCDGPNFDNCLSCNDTNALLSGSTCICKTGYYNSAIVANEVTCTACHVTCQDCSDVSTCVSCDDPINSEPNGNRCVCKIGFYDSNPDLNAITCLPCHSTCDLCDGPSANQCRNCVDLDAVLDGGPPGTCKCSLGKYDTGSLSPKLNCQNCDKSCLTCNGNTDNNCLSCKSNAALVSGLGSKCMCTPNTYWRDNNGDCQLCNTAITGCSICSANGTVCTTCSGSLFLYNNKCHTCHSTCDQCEGSAAYQCRNCIDSFAVLDNGPTGICQCPVGMYDTGNSSPRLDCQNCDNTCRTCNGNTANDCLTCKSNANLTAGLGSSCQCSVNSYWRDGNGDCKLCSTNISQCLTCTPNGTTCNSCNSSYLLYSNTCIQCHGTCSSCVGPGINQCQSCTGNFQTLGSGPPGPCVCQDGFYDSNGALNVLDCKPCHTTCQKCNGPTSNDCTDCVPNAQLQPDKSCLCDDSHSMTGTGLCWLCDNQIPKCQVCNGDGTICNQCQPGYALVNSTTCSSCHQSCATCTGTGSNQCQLCANPYTYLDPPSIGNCKCIAGRYDDLSLTPQLNCVKCHDSCQECSLGGPLGCTSCLTGTNTVLNGIGPTNCKCAIGYYDDIASDLINCIKCPDSCGECYKSGTDIVCTACDNSANAEIATTPNHCICSDGYVNTSGTGSLTCTACFDSCATCDGPNFYDCLSCNDTNALLSGSICICKTGYYNSAIVANEVTCTACHMTCQDCSDAATCTTCHDSINSEPNGNVCTCKNGFYDNDPDPQAINCIPCNSTCSKCIGGTLNDCTECSDLNAQLIGFPSGYCECKNQFYDANTSPSGLLCKACHSSCSQCIGPSKYQCTSCLDTNSQLIGIGQGYCKCQNKFWDSDLTDGVNCQACPDTCDLCREVSGNPQCDTCLNSANAELSLTLDSCQCFSGFYDNNPNPAILDCIQCPGDTCSECSLVLGVVTCSICKNSNAVPSIASPQDCMCDLNYYDDGTLSPQLKCVKCHSSCATCQTPSASNCTSCMDINATLASGTNNYCVCKPGFWNTETTDVVNCSSCPGSCQTCQNGGFIGVKCLTCNNSINALVDPSDPGQCICEDGYYSPTNSPLNCVQCDVRCSKCDGASLNDCTSCQDPNSFLNGSTCKCNQGYYDNEIYNVDVYCVKCPITCAICSFSSGVITCLACKDPTTQQLNGSACECIPGKYNIGLPSQELNCQDCHPSCKTCTSGDANECLDCNDTFAVLNGASPSNCICDANHYDNDSSDLVNCVDCPDTCNTCHDTLGSAICDTCQNSINSKVNPDKISQCMCEDGYYNDQSILPQLNCVNVCTDNNCKQCDLVSSIETCITCKDENAEMNPTDPKMCICKDGFISDGAPNFSCEKCFSSCSSCDSPASTSCLTCTDVNASLKAGPPSECICNKGYFDQDAGNGVECVACSITCTDCSKVSGKVLCQDCSSSNAEIKEDKCECLPGYFNSDPNGFLCEPCHANCKTCIAGGIDGCVTCIAENAVVSGKSGECKCYEFFYDNDPEDSLNCQQCDPTCKECQSGEGIISCVTCGSDYAQIDSQELDKCICLTGFVDKDQGKGIQCECEVPFVPNVDKCECPSNSYSVSQKCECNEGYINTATLPEISCMQCQISNCITCQSQSGQLICDKCFTGFKLSENKKSCTSAQASLGISSVTNNVIVINTQNVSIYSTNDIKLTINGQEIKNFTFEQTSDDEFQITVLETEYQTIQGELVLTTTGDIQVSTSYTVKAVQYEQSDEQQYSEAEKQEAKQLGSAAQSTSQGTVGGGMGISSLTGNPAALWQLLNTIQLLAFIPMTNIDLPLQLVSFFAAITEYNFVPNAFEYLLEQQSQAKNKLTERNLYETNDFFLNCGDLITVLLVNIAMFPLFYALTFIPWQRGAHFMQKICKSYKWDIFIRFWIEAYLEIGLAAVLQMFSLSFDSLANVLNSLSALIGLALFLTTPVALARFFKTSIQKIKMGDSYEVKENWETLFYEFSEEGSEIKLWFYFWFLLRRLIYVLNQIFVIDYPGLQVIINILHCIIVNFIQNFVIVLVYQPYLEKYTNIIMAICEFGITAIFIMTSFYIFDLDYDARNLLKDIVLYTVFGIMGIQFIGMLITVGIAVYKTIKKLKEMRRNRKVNKSISFSEIPDSSQLDKLNLSGNQ